MSKREYERDDQRDGRRPRHDHREYERDDQRDKKRPRHDQREQLPEIHSIFRGEVVSIQAYGAFIKIPGLRKNGLVHKSQISTTRVEEVSEVLEVGDKVYCKVISVGEEDSGKISLSMKVVNQGDGRDLDPNLVVTNQEEMRKKKGGTYIPQRIELGAVLNTVCRQCGTKGHLSQNCFQAPGSKSYELLPEVDLSQPPPPDERQKESHRKKKKKKEKKKQHKEKHKKKKRKKSSSSESDSDSSSSSSSDSDSPARKKRSKKHKHHKHRDSSSSSSSDSSDDDNDKRRRHGRKKTQEDSLDRKRSHKQKHHHRDR